MIVTWVPPELVCPMHASVHIPCECVRYADVRGRGFLFNSWPQLTLLLSLWPQGIWHRFIYPKNTSLTRCQTHRSCSISDLTLSSDFGRCNTVCGASEIRAAHGVWAPRPLISHSSTTTLHISRRRWPNRACLTIWMHLKSLHLHCIPAQSCLPAARAGCNLFKKRETSRAACGRR